MVLDNEMAGQGFAARCAGQKSGGRYIVRHPHENIDIVSIDEFLEVYRDSDDIRLCSVDASFFDSTGRTLLHYACCKHPDVWRTVTEGQWADMIRYLVSRGVDVNVRSLHTATAGDRFLTPLMYAATLGRVDAVRCLVLEFDADRSLTCKNGLTAYDHGLRCWGSGLAIHRGSPVIEDGSVEIVFLLDPESDLTDARANYLSNLKSKSESEI